MRCPQVSLLVLENVRPHPRFLRRKTFIPVVVLPCFLATIVSTYLASSEICLIVSVRHVSELVRMLRSVARRQSNFLHNDSVLCLRNRAFSILVEYTFPTSLGTFSVTRPRCGKTNPSALFETQSHIRQHVCQGL